MSQVSNSMSADFRDVIESGSVKSPIPNTTKDSVKSNAKTAQTSILELVEGLNIDGISSKMNPEMKEKVLIPLANLLDKYGVSESLGESNTAQAGLGLMSLLGDVAPVIKGLADYISGQRNSLREEDREFLDRIKDSQLDGDFSDLFVSESETETPAPVTNSMVGPRGENLNAINVADSQVDWYAVMGVENPNAQVVGLNAELTDAFFAKDVSTKLPVFNVSADKPTLVGLQSLEDIAATSGINYDDVNKADSKYKEIETEDSNEIIPMTEIGGVSESQIPNEANGDSIFSQPDDLLSGMDMKSFEISFESEE